MKVLGIITARGGSKGIPRKNIKEFCGKPLLAWTAKAGIASGVLDRFIISTDDQEIADIAKSAGVEVPFMRPEELSQDTTPSLPVLQHALQWMKDTEGYAPDYVVLLEPTSPGRQAFHIKEAVELAESTGADSVIGLGAVPGHHNFHWQISLEEDKKASLVDGTAMHDVIKSRQQLPQTYFRNGSLYVFKPELLFSENPSLYGDDVRGYVVEAKYSFDIDTPEDWTAAESQLKKVLTEEE